MEDRAAPAMPEGVLLVDKPPGPTSHDVVDGVRRLLDVRRVGHAGTLDPAASGLLVVLAGRATRRARDFSGLDKTYAATVALGTATDTGDAQGGVTAHSPAPALTAVRAREALAGLVGERLQTPPVYSAVKVRGRPAYWYARRGTPVTLRPRAVRIDRLELVAARGALLDVRVACSAGTYVRVLAEEIGRALGTAAHLASLRREAVGPFRVEEALPWPASRAAALARLVPTAMALARLVPGA